MRQSIIAIISFLPLTFQSCKTSPTEYATNWTSDIKEKIKEDASQQPDKTIFDSTNYDLTIYKEGKKLQYYHLNPKINKDGKLQLDTALSIFYSGDQNFELVRELCPVSDRSFEGIRYKGKHLGLAEFKYCDGKAKKRGFRFNGEVGVWKEYDTDGKVLNETDHGNVNRLKKLKDIKYYR